MYKAGVLLFVVGEEVRRTGIGGLEAGEWISQVNFGGGLLKRGPDSRPESSSEEWS